MEWRREWRGVEGICEDIQSAVTEEKKKGEDKKGTERGEKRGTGRERNRRNGTLQAFPFLNSILHIC
jgi:hypothetical protein